MPAGARQPLQGTAPLHANCLHVLRLSDLASGHETFLATEGDTLRRRRANGELESFHGRHDTNRRLDVG